MGWEGGKERHQLADPESSEAMVFHCVAFLTDAILTDERSEDGFGSRDWLARPIEWVKGLS